MAATASVYREFQDRISVRGYCRLVNLCRWRLRYHLQTEEQREKRQEHQLTIAQRVQEVALAHPTYGYRRVHVLVQRDGIGKDRVRHVMRELGLAKSVPRKSRAKAPAVTLVRDLPAGRRVQIDATRFSLRSGPAWVYLVLDVLSRSCIGLKSVPRLSKHSAAEVLAEATDTLRELGIEDPLVVQSDAGSDFTSAHFQQLCSSLGSWVRCRVNEKGGMGILERLHRTFKYEFVFREEVATLPDLLRVTPDFERWYNHERLHSSIGYDTPWDRLTGVETLT